MDQRFVQRNVVTAVNVKLWVPLSYSPHQTATSLVNQKRIFIKGSISSTDIKNVSFFYFWPRLVEKVHVDASWVISNQKLCNFSFFGPEIALFGDHYDFYFNIFFGCSEVSDGMGRFSPEDERIGLLEKVSLDLYPLVHLKEIQFYQLLIINVASIDQ